jgi:hypothetical protein
MINESPRNEGRAKNVPYGAYISDVLKLYGKDIEILLSMNADDIGGSGAAAHLYDALSAHPGLSDSNYRMLTRYIYSRHGIMFEVLYEVFHAVIQFIQYTFVYVCKYI